MTLWGSLVVDNWAGMRARSRSPARRGAIRGAAGARCKGGQAARKLHAGAIFKRPSTAEVVADILQGEASQELRAERKAPPPAAPPPAAPPVAADPALDEKLLALAFAADAAPSKDMFASDMALRL